MCVTGETWRSTAVRKGRVRELLRIAADEPRDIAGMAEKRASDCDTEAISE